MIAQGKQNDVATQTGWCADEGSVDPKYGKRTSEEFESEVRRPPVGGQARFFGLTPAGDLADEFLKFYPASTPGKSQIDSARAQNMVSTFIWAKQRAAHSKTPVYTYLWDHPLPGPNRDLYRAFHSSELPYVFNSLAGVRRAWEPIDYAIAEKTTSYWANFIKTGNPNGAGLENWPAFNVNTPVTMELGDRFEVRPIADAAQVKLLEKILSGAASSTGP
jgi:para-nitrobenzyl esterase